MRTIVRTLAGFGCVTAALLLGGSVHGQSMGGGTGSFSGGGGGGGGGGGSSNSGSNSSSSAATNFSITGQSLQTSIGATPSILNSFNNVGTGTATNGYVSSSNPLATYYYNPLSQGLISISSSGNSTPSNVAFGAALYGNVSAGGTGSGGTGSGGSAISRASGGTSSTGGLNSLSGTATLRGTGTTGNAILFTGGGSYGPANGRRGPVIPFTMRGPVRSIPMAARRPDLQGIIASSTALSAPGGIIVSTDGNAIVLTGTVATEAERDIAANVLRLSPGVSAIKNNLTVGPPPGPGTSPGPGTTPGPGPIAPPPGS